MKQFLADPQKLADANAMCVFFPGGSLAITMDVDGFRKMIGFKLPGNLSTSPLYDWLHTDFRKKSRNKA